MKRYEIKINDGDEIFPVWYNGNSEHEVLLRLVRDLPDIKIISIKEVTVSNPTALDHPGFYIILIVLVISIIFAFF